MIKISLKAARVNAGLSQKEVAKILKVSNKTIHNWENGGTSPSYKHIDALCDLYGVSYDDLNFLPTNSLKGNFNSVTNLI
jgi:transcriptional regulator with XRE-family HTH domain